MKILFRRGVIPTSFNTFPGSHVSSEPVSTNASNGAVSSSSRLGLRATILTLNTLIVRRIAWHLEEVLQRELHDPGILRRRDLPERVAVERGVRVVHAESVCEIERFSPKFNLLHFLDLKCS